MIQLSNGIIQALISKHGAELQQVNKVNDKNMLWNKGTTHWNRISPLLFPIVGRLKNDEFNYKEDVFFMKQHGFARDLIFDVVEQESDRITLSLKESNLTLQQFPFRFQLSITYKLEYNRLNVIFNITNHDIKTMPFSIGGHPGFQLHSLLEEYSVNFYNDFEIYRHEIKGGLYTGEVKKMIIENTLVLKNEFFKEDAIVFKNPTFNQVTLEHMKSGKLVSVGSSHWDAIGLWTKPGAPFFCIEPWWGWADSESSNGNIETKEGIRTLDTGTTQTISYYIEIH